MPKDPKLRESFYKAELERLKTERDERLKAESQTSKMKRAAAREKSEAKREEAWSKLKQSSDRLIEEGQKGYDNWMSAMSSILVHCHLISKANPVGSLLRGVGGYAAERVETYTGLDVRPSGIAEQISTKIKGSISPTVTLPDLQYFVSFDNNKLNVANLGKSIRRADGKELTDEQKDILKTGLKKGVEAWLAKHGYTPTPRQAGKFQDSTGNPLTTAEFERLRKDPTEGLNAFLNGHFDMRFEERSSFTP